MLGDDGISYSDYATELVLLLFIKMGYEQAEVAFDHKLPDKVLFEAGVGTDIRRDLMHKRNLHTILRLPRPCLGASRPSGPRRPQKTLPHP